MKSFTAILIVGLAAAAMAEFNIIPKPVDFENVGHQGAQTIQKGIASGIHRVENEVVGNHGVQNIQAGVTEHSDIVKRAVSPYAYYNPYNLGYGYPTYGSRSYYPYSAFASSMYPYSAYKYPAVPSATRGYSYYFNY